MSESTAPVTPSRGTSLLALQPPRFSPLAPFVLTAGRWLIGTAAECDVRLETPGVQPQHALLLVSGSRVVLKSLDVRTWVNDGLVQETILRRNDRIAIGPLTFVVRSATADEVASALEPAPPSRQPAAAVPPVTTSVASTPIASTSTETVAPVAAQTSTAQTSTVMAPLVAMQATMPAAVPANVQVPATLTVPVTAAVPTVDRHELERRLNELAALEHRLREAEATLHDRTSQAQAHEQTLASEQSSIEARHRELIQKNTDLAALTAETAIVRNELMVEQDELAHLAAEIDQRHLSLKAQEEAYHQERQQWEFQRQALTEELQQRSRRLAEEEASQQQAFSHRQAELNQIESAIQEQLEECNERSETLDRSRQLIEQEREQANQQTEALKLQQAELAKRLAQLGEQETQIDQWQQQLSARQAQLSTAEAEWWTRQERRASPEETLASERDAAEIRRLQTLLDRVTDELSLVRSDNTALWSARDSLQQELADLQVDHARLVTQAEQADLAAAEQTPPLALIDNASDSQVIDELRTAAAELQAELLKREQALADQAALCALSQARVDALQQDYARAQQELSALQQRCTTEFQQREQVELERQAAIEQASALQQDYARAQQELSALQQRYTTEFQQREQVELERQAALEQASALQQDYARAQQELSALQQRCTTEFQQREQVELERHAALEQASALQQEQSALATALEITQARQAEHTERLAELETQRFALEQEAAHWRRRADSAGELLTLAATGWTDLAQQPVDQTQPPVNPLMSEQAWSTVEATAHSLPPERPRSAQQVWDRLDSVDRLLNAATSTDPADSAEALEHLRYGDHPDTHSLPTPGESAAPTTLEPTPSEPATSAEPVSEEVSALRSELARLFDLPGMTAASDVLSGFDSAPVPATQTDPDLSGKFSEPAELASPEVAANEAEVPWRQIEPQPSAEPTTTATDAQPIAVDDWQARLNSMLAATGTAAPTPEPIPVAPISAVAEVTSLPQTNLPQTDLPQPNPTLGLTSTQNRDTHQTVSSTTQSHGVESEDTESISAYMARLLQRNGNISSSAAAVPPPVPVEQPSPVMPAAPMLVTPHESLADDDFVEERPARKRLAPESLDSFRQVANLSARSAVARHSWQTVRGAVLLKAVLLVMCIAGMVAFFGGPLVGGQVFLVSGMGCAIAGVWMAYDLGLTIRQMRQQQQELQQTLGSLVDSRAGPVAVVRHSSVGGVATVSEPEWSIVSDGSEPPPA